MADISVNTACKELKIAQISQLNQLFQLLHLIHIQYIRPRLLWVKSYANEEKCKQWRQQRFAYKNCFKEFNTWKCMESCSQRTTNMAAVTSRAVSSYSNFLEQKKILTCEKNSVPWGFFLYTCMAAISLLCTPIWRQWLHNENYQRNLSRPGEVEIAV